MASLNIQGIESDTLAILAAKAAQEGESIDALVLRWIRQELDQMREKPMQHRYDDLDDLAGVWTAEEAAAFQTATAHFGQIDPDQWR